MINGGVRIYPDLPRTFVINQILYITYIFAPD